MGRLSRKLVLAASVIACLLLAPAIGPDQTPGLHFARALAEPADAAEKAFAAAKELGTAEAWNAFLANYPTGFHADLARAYLKKLETGGQQAATPPPAALPPPDFPIVAGSWGGIVRDGPGQSYGKVDSLDEGQEVTLMARTDVMENGYPWFKIAYGDDGKGFQWGGILCSAEEERPDLYKTCPKTEAKKEKDDDDDDGKASTKSKTKARASTKSCSSGRVLIDGKCIQKGAAAGYCGPGYRPQGGKCVKGYQAPKPNTPLSTEQRKAVNKGCPKGQVWNAQEGCHEDD